MKTAGRAMLSSQARGGRDEGEHADQHAGHHHHQHQPERVGQKARQLREQATKLKNIAFAAEMRPQPASSGANQ